MKALLLKPLYDRVVGGLPVLGTPAEAARRVGGNGASVGRLVALYTGLAGSTGFVCGLPGFLLMPVTLPANLTGVAALQLHLCAAIAHLGGHDLADPATRDACVRCLLDRMDRAGENTEEEEVTTRTGVKLAERGVRYVVEKTTRLAGRAARGYALRRIGLGRLPLVGGVLGAGSDAVVTRHVAACAKARFLAA